MENTEQTTRQIERQTAKIVSIKEIISGEYIKQEGWEPNYILSIKNEKLSRINTIAIVVTIPENSQSVFVDDGSGKIEVRTFEQKQINQVVIYEAKCVEFSGLSKTDVNNSLIYPLILNFIKCVDVSCDELIIVFVGDKFVGLEKTIENMEKIHNVVIKCIHIKEWFEKYSDIKHYPTCNVSYDDNNKKYSYEIIENNIFTLPLVNILSCNKDVISQEQTKVEFFEDKRGVLVNELTKNKEEKNDG
jgi:hypothetical protein